MRLFFAIWHDTYGDDANFSTFVLYIRTRTYIVEKRISNNISGFFKISIDLYDECPSNLSFKDFHGSFIENTSMPLCLNDYVPRTTVLVRMIDER